MKKLLSILVAFLVIGGLTACANDSGEEAIETIKIGVNLELTGDVSVYGIPERNAFEQATAEINALRSEERRVG